MTPSSTIEFLIWLLIAASIIAVIAARLRIPYTVALVLEDCFSDRFICRYCNASSLILPTG